MCKTYIFAASDVVLSCLIHWKIISQLLENPASTVVGCARAHTNLHQNDFLCVKMQGGD